MPPSTPKKPKFHYLTRDQRLQILTLHDAGFIYTEILHRMPNVTFHQIEHACQSLDPTPKKGTGRPPTLDDTRTQELITFVCASRAHRLLTYA